MSESQQQQPTTAPDRPLQPHLRAIVIGASSGIGAAIARELVQNGYIVAGLARRQDVLEKTCAAINASAADGVFVKPYAHDVTDYAAIPELFEQIIRDLGGLDLVVYNAGVMPAVAADEYNFENDKLQIEVNLLGGMAWLNQAAVRFQAVGSGRIIGIGSVAGDRGRRNNPAYHTSKGGLAIYLESLRNRLAPSGVTVTTIKPGFVDTQMLDGVESTFWVISPEKAAELIVRASERRRQTVYIPGRWRLVMLIIQHIPSFVFRRLSI